MNTVKASVCVIVTLIFISGCGSKKEDALSLPPEQILAGNAILAPQSVTLEAYNIVTPGNVSMDSTSMELSGSVVSDKPTNKDIQQALQNAGIYKGSIDGNIGPKSKKAIRDFQTQNGLSADGKVGSRTWKKLSVYLRNVSASAVEDVPISN